jgi:hypothetical protein
MENQVTSGLQRKKIVAAIKSLKSGSSATEIGNDNSEPAEHTTKAKKSKKKKGKERAEEARCVAAPTPHHTRVYFNPFHTGGQ